MVSNEQRFNLMLAAMVGQPELTQLIDDMQKDTDNTCDMLKHEWTDHYYGYKCAICGMFVAFGCEPWAPIDDWGLDTDDEAEARTDYADVFN